MKWFLLLSIILAFSILSGQEINDDYYRYGVSPSDLPDYLLGKGSVLPSGIFIGISDPDLDSATAATQALYRAHAIALLSHSSKTRTLYDIYSGEEYSGSGGTFQSFDEVSYTDSVVLKYSVVDTFYTNFNEAIIRINVLDNIENKDSVKKGDDVSAMENVYTSYEVTYEKFRMEYEWGQDREYEEQSEFRVCLSDSLPWKDIVTIFRHTDNEEAMSTINDVEHYFPELRYNYIDREEGKQQYFKNGLWIHFIRVIMDQLAAEARLISENVKKMGEVYETNSQINQAAAINYLEFQIQSITFNEGKVTVDALIESKH